MNPLPISSARLYGTFSTLGETCGADPAVIEEKDAAACEVHHPAKSRRQAALSMERTDEIYYVNRRPGADALGDEEFRTAQGCRRVLCAGSGSIRPGANDGLSRLHPSRVLRRDD